MISSKHLARTRILKRTSDLLSSCGLLVALWAVQACSSSRPTTPAHSRALKDTASLSIDSLSVVVLQEDSLEVSLRGLSVVNDSVAWVSGSRGSVALTSDKGKSWTWLRLPAAYQEIDFRDIEAFSATEAVILSAGSPLIILRTEDAGLHWDLVYNDERPEIFFDGMAFSADGNRAIAFGDPIAGLLPLLTSVDAGKTWVDITEIAQIRLEEGEAGFAASGSSIYMVDDQVFIGTGGAHSRLLRSADFGQSWTVMDTPIKQGLPSQGIFSLAFRDAERGIIVGGDYLDDKNHHQVSFITEDGGKTWISPVEGPGGYRSSIAHLNGGVYIACGTSGVDITSDEGKNWAKLTDQSYHVVSSSKAGNWVVLAGANGRIATLSQ